jgi:hypothetical protein
MRNEILARHGYVFKTAEMADYFSKQGWYEPDEGYTESRLSKIELENIKIIKRVEDGKAPGFDVNDGEEKAQTDPGDMNQVIPLKVGNEWTYAVSGRGQETVRITSRHDANLFDEMLSGKNLGHYTWYDLSDNTAFAVTQAGLIWATRENEDDGPWVYVYRMFLSNHPTKGQYAVTDLVPARPKTELSGAVDELCTWRWEGNADVKTPAGEFSDCRWLRGYYDESNRESLGYDYRDIYIKPGIGVVKEQKVRMGFGSMVTWSKELVRCNIKTTLALGQ